MRRRAESWLVSFAAVVGTVALYVLCAAIAPKLHAGTCPDPPLFDTSGPDCTAARQTIECGCSEHMDWDLVLADPTTGAPAADWYQVMRQDPGGLVRIVGDTRFKDHPAYIDEDGSIVPERRITFWCFAWDEPMPAEGQLYLYRVGACAVGQAAGQPAILCSDWSSRSVDYRAAPYWVTQ